MAGTRQRTPPKPRAGGATAVTTTHPTQAIRGGLSLIAWPAIVFLLLVPLGGPLAYRAADAYGMRVLGLVLAGCFGVLAFGVHEHANARMKWLRRQGVWSIGWAAAFLGWVVAFGPDRWWFGLELTTGLVLTVWWTFAKTEPWRGTGQDAHAGEDGWARAVGLADSTRPVKVKDVGDERHVDVEHTDNTHDDMVKAREKIEAKGKLPAGSVRVERITQAGRRLAYASRLVISRESFLESGISDWSGPDRPGALVSDPVRVSWAADRKPTEWRMTPTGEDDGGFIGSPALISSGQSGAAKTAFQMNTLGNLVARRGIVVWGSDTRKAGQWVPFVRPFIDWLAVTPEETKAQLDSLATIVPERTEMITELTGEDRWTPICWTEFGIPFLLWWGAEAAPLGGILEEELTRLNEVIRSAGGKLIGEWQRPSESNLSTDLRNLVPESMAFRCDKPEDGRMALKEETLDAGAEPWTIPLEGAEGMHYAELVGEPQTRWGMRRRTEKPNRLLVAATVAEWMTTHPEWHRLDERTAQAAGPAYAARQVCTVTTWLGSRWGKPPQLRDPSIMAWIEKAKQQTAPTPAPAPTPQEEDDMDPEETPDLAMAEYEQDEGHVDEDKEIAMEADRVLEAVDADVNFEEGPDPDDTPLGPLAPALTALAQPHEGDDDPDLNWTTRQTLPRPSPQQRAVNFQALTRRLFTDPNLRREDSDLRAEVIEQVDGRWAVAETETIAAIWLGFPGEDVRPAMYPRLRAHEKAGNAKQLRRGRWAISERALTEALVIPDDYDPDPPVDPDEEPDEERNVATERDMAEVLQ